MKVKFDSGKNYEKTRKAVGYQPRKETKAQTYFRIGFKCGLEIHQQLHTEKKLFCHCPAGRYQNADEFDAELVRHMRPTLSELGEYDGTALMEFKTRKNIIYRIKNETTCTYEVDDTPPFKINPQALDIAMEIAMLLKCNIVGEIHITRKQYLDGSIPTGFQRTAIIGIEGALPLKSKTIRVIQLSIEEDSCREVSDVGHWRTYTTDRLGMPLIETVTYPDMKTPDEAAEAAHYIRFLCRSSGKVRTGIGAARQDVNVSVTGGTRVEIKGVSHIAWIPELTHNEAFRQKALLEIRKELNRRIPNHKEWQISWKELDYDFFKTDYPPLREAGEKKYKLLAVNLPQFKGILSHFTQPGLCFADEIGDRLKVIACLERPNHISSEQLQEVLSFDDFTFVRKLLKAGEDDAQLLIWGPEEDMKTALETITERCRLAGEGVPNETRKALENGTTIFERVLPGPDRMYPDTDSAPISVEEEFIRRVKARLPKDVHLRMKQLREWNIPADTYHYILKRNLVPVIERIITELEEPTVFVGCVFGHLLKRIEGRLPRGEQFPYERMVELFRFVREQKLEREIIPVMLPVFYDHPNMDFDSILTTIQFRRLPAEQILGNIPLLREKFKEINTSKDPAAETRWIMGQLRNAALGNIPLRALHAAVSEGVQQ